MKSFLTKLKSRKFLAAIAGVVTGLAMVFGLDEGTISAVAGAVVSASSVIAYIVTEGKVDAAAVDAKSKAVDETSEVVKEIN
jgi:phage shock protein PspC (stress-responsive transcriptional regulator)